MFVTTFQQIFAAVYVQGSIYWPVYLCSHMAEIKEFNIGYTQRLGIIIPRWFAVHSYASRLVHQK